MRRPCPLLVLAFVVTTATNGVRADQFSGSRSITWDSVRDDTRSFFSHLFLGGYDANRDGEIDPTERASSPVFRSAVAGAFLVGLACGLLGAFVTLRGMALFGDMIGHSVLPGITLGYVAAGGSKSTPAMLAGALGALEPPGKTRFLPYLGGERTPLNDAAIRGAFIGLEHATDREAATRAVLEGVAFAIRDCRDALAATGTRIDRLIAVGGGSRSDYWLSAIATALATPVSVPVAGDFGGAFGAARLAIMAATGAGAAIATAPATARTFEPQTRLLSAFDDGFARFRAAQSAIKGLT